MIRIVRTVGNRNYFKDPLTRVDVKLPLHVRSDGLRSFLLGLLRLLGEIMISVIRLLG